MKERHFECGGATLGVVVVGTGLGLDSIHESPISDALSLRCAEQPPFSDAILLVAKEGPRRLRLGMHHVSL